MNEISKVSPEIGEVVERSLEQIEQSLNARIVLAMDSGLRGKGTPTLDSPHCIRFVYIHALDWYLRLTPGADHVELPVSNDFTLTGWDIGRLLKTMKTGTTDETAWLRSAVIYRADADVLARLQNLLARRWQPALEFRQELDHAKKLFGGWGLGTNTTSSDFIAAMRAILAARWIAGGHGPVPENITGLCHDLNEELRNEINVLLQANATTPKGSVVPPAPQSQVFFLSELQRLKDVHLEESAQTENLPFDRLYAELVRRFG